MLSKTLSIIIFLFSIIAVNSQVSWIHSFGEPLEKEFALNSFAEAPEEPGVVLYERGYYTVDQADGFIRLFKEVHKKVKVFDAEKFKYATVEIPYMRWGDVQENITNIRAITHNGTVKKYVGAQSMYDSNMSGNYSVKKFTFPDIKDGSILEYIYRIETPMLSNLGTWRFMNEMPTIYSELHMEIPGNYNYNRTLRGTRKLDVNNAKIRKSCFILPGFKVAGDCEVATYAMKNIPAFKPEKHMLSEKNYIPSLKFELAEMIRVNQTKQLNSKSWSGVDKDFKVDNNLGRQLNFSRFFKKNMPDSILSISNDLERAKAVYYFVQSKIKWNKRSGFRNFADVKEAFNNENGNSSEINLSLINAFEAAGIDAKIMAIATRSQAVPTTLHPVVTDFNYMIVFVHIANQKYFLDATEEYSQFGVLPYRALNFARSRSRF